MEYLVHTEDKIEWAVKQLRNHCPGGPSGMRAEHNKGWLAEAQKEEAAAAQTAAVEGKTTVLGGSGGEETEEIRKKMPAYMTNW